MLSGPPSGSDRLVKIAVALSGAASLFLLSTLVAGQGIAAPGQPIAPLVPLPELWVVDVSGMGSYCISDPRNVRLRRQSADKAASFRLSGPANSPSALVEFAAGQLVAAIDPDAFPITDGSEMTISDPETGATIGRIGFAVVPAQFKDSDHLREILKARDCSAQLELQQALAARADG